LSTPPALPCPNWARIKLLLLSNFTLPCPKWAQNKFTPERLFR
jgi:hypothetical protein